MVLRKLTGLFACVLVIGMATFASAGVPDLDLTTAGLVYTGTETLSLLNYPNGAGKPFTEAFLPGGSETDGTIQLTLRDGFGLPIDNFPRADMWIESTDGGMVACGGTAIADLNTDEFGDTQWQNATFAGGWSQSLTLVKINGDVLQGSFGGLALSFNSPDINADGTVNLSDAGEYTARLGGGYSYEIDFNYDGSENLPDAGYMRAGLGASCP